MAKCKALVGLVVKGLDPAVWYHHRKIFCTLAIKFCGAHCVAARAIQVGHRDSNAYSRSVLLRLHNHSNPRRNAGTEDWWQSADVVWCGLDSCSDAVSAGPHKCWWLRCNICSPLADGYGRGKCG